MTIIIESNATERAEWIGIVRKALLSVGLDMPDDWIEEMWGTYSNQIWYTDFLEPTYGDLADFLHWGGWTEERLDYAWCVENADWFE